MPSNEESCRFQKAVLWPATGFDDYGKVSISTVTGVEIDVRWEDVQEETLDSNGNTVTTDARVVVDQDITVGSVMWQGALEDVASPPTNLKQVVSFGKIPDVKGRENRRVVRLIRFSNKLPSVV